MARENTGGGITLIPLGIDPNPANADPEAPADAGDQTPGSSSQNERVTSRTEKTTAGEVSPGGEPRQTAPDNANDDSEDASAESQTKLKSGQRIPSVDSPITEAFNRAAELPPAAFSTMLSVD